MKKVKGCVPQSAFLDPLGTCGPLAESPGRTPVSRRQADAQDTRFSVSDRDR